MSASTGPTGSGRPTFRAGSCRSCCCSSTCCATSSSEPGLETITRYLLRLAGLRVETQVSIAGLGRVDLLVEGHLIVELDGWEFHGDEKAFEADRRRDTVAASGRYRVLRFTYRQVMFEWPSVYAAVLAAL